MTDSVLPTLAWRLRVLMAERDIRTTRELRRRLMDVGVSVSEPQLGRVVKRLPKQLNSELLAALCAVLKVSPGELIAIPGYRSHATAPAQPATQEPVAMTPPEAAEKPVPNVLPRSASGRPQATAIPRPKY